MLTVAYKSACNLEDEVFSSKGITGGERIWFFFQFNLPESNDKYGDYYYFGSINENLYQKIRSHEIEKGFITLEKVRYWTNDDIIESYADDIYSDELTFRTEDIMKVFLVKSNPVIGYKYPDSEIIQEEDDLSTDMNEETDET